MILIADPHPESRAELSHALADAGHRVVAVATGMEAAQVLIETRPSFDDGVHSVSAWLDHFSGYAIATRTATR